MANKREIKTILIIEDEADVQKFVSRVLKANNGEPAIDVCGDEIPDLVLLA